MKSTMSFAVIRSSTSFPGSNSSEVTFLKEKLTYLGFFPRNVTANGIFGPTTFKAAQAFQQKNNSATLGTPGYGIVGPKEHRWS